MSTQNGSNPYAVENPYAAAATTSSVAELRVTEPIEFAGDVTFADVATILRDIPQLCFAGAFFLLMSVVGTGMLLAIMMGGATAKSEGYYFALVPLGVIYFGYLVWYHSGFGAAWRRLRLVPRLTGPMQGRFINDRLELVTSRGQTVMRLSAISGVRVKHTSIAITSDHQQMYLITLPAHMFVGNGFTNLAAILMPIARTLPIRSRIIQGMDGRLLDAELVSLPPAPAGAASFSGRVLARHIMHRSLFLAAVVPGCLRYGRNALMFGILAWLALTLDVKPWLYLNLFIVVMNLLLIGLTLFGVIRFSQRKETPLADIAGWVTADGIAHVTPMHGSFFNWTTFSSVIIDSERILLRMPGTYVQFVVMVREHFASDDDWDKAVTYVRNGQVRS